MRGLLAMVSGAFVDVWFRLYWIVKYRWRPHEFEGYRWRQIKSTKRWQP